MNKILIGLVALLLLTSCGVYEEGDIIINEPLIINTTVTIDGGVVEGEYINNSGNYTYINDSTKE